MLALALAACSPEVGLLQRELGGPDLLGDAGALSPGPTGDPNRPEAGFPFDRPDRIFDISLDVPPESVEALERNGPYMPATFHLGELSMEVGVRLKGSTTFDHVDGKPALKIGFDAFVPGQRFMGLEHLTLNNMKWDKTMMREAVAYHLYNQLGVLAPRQGYASVTFNGLPYGLYSMVETLDNQWLERVIPDDADGNLYDTTFNYTDLTSAGLPNFHLQEGDELTAFTDLQQLVGELGDRGVWDVLQTRFDLDSTLSFMAMDLASPNYDGYSRNTNNYLIYHATATDRWYLVPWGQDQAFLGGGGVYNGALGRLTAGCLSNSECKAALDQHVHDLVGVWEDGVYEWAVDRAAMVTPACEADTNKNARSCEQEDLLEIIQTRPEDIRRYVP